MMLTEAIRLAPLVTPAAASRGRQGDALGKTVQVVDSGTTKDRKRRWRSTAFL